MEFGVPAGLFSERSLLRMVCGAVLVTTALVVLGSNPATAQINQLLQNLLQNVAPSGRPLPSPYYPAPAYPPAGYPAAPTVPAPQIHHAQPNAPEFATVGSPAAAPMALRASPSFDCVKAGTPTERAICRDPELATLDRTLSQAFEQARAAAPADAANTLLTDQRAWIRRRNSCRAVAVCIRRAMTLRLAELQSARIPVSVGPQPPAGATGAGVPSSPKPRDVLPEPTQAAAAVAQHGADGDDPLASLAHPPAGILPLPLERLEGHYAASLLDRRVSGIEKTESDGTRDVLLLLAIGNLPGYLENKANLPGVVGLLTPQAGNSVFSVGTAGWAGRNEFEQDRAKQAFYATYAPELRNLAPKPPFVLRSIEPARLEPYSAIRGGFPLPLPQNEGQLGIASEFQGHGLSVAPGFTTPDLFWPTDRAAGEALLRRLPSDRQVWLYATIDVASVDPSVGTVTLRLQRLALYAPGGEQKLYEFPLTPAGESRLASASASGSAAPPAQAPADVATANGVAAAKRWGLPTLRSLPWIDAETTSSISSSVSGFGGDLGFGGPANLRKLSPLELWTRAVRAMGLASTPEAARTLRDMDAGASACMLLPQDVQTQMFGQDVCNTGVIPGKEFAFKDGAVAFRSRELPKIISTAPHLPLRLVMTIPATPGKFDSNHPGFALRNSVNWSGRLFGSPLDVKLPDFWPATEAEARALLSGIQLNPRLWLAVTLTIDGATVGRKPAAIWEDGSGLPDHAAWILHTEDITLYRDAALQQKLYRFDLARLPLPILGTPAEQHPVAAGPAPVDGEAALLALLKQGLPDGLRLDWSTAAQVRFGAEGTWRSRPDWREFDPWGVFFPAEPGMYPESVERYRQWTVLRGKALPDTLTISRPVVGPPIAGSAPGHIAVFGEGAGLGYFNGASSNASLPGAGVASDLRALGIEPAQLLPMQLYLPGTSGLPVYIAVPQPTQSYVIETGATIPALAPGQPPPRLVVQATLSGIDILRYEKAQDITAIVLRIVPKSAELRRDLSVIATAPLSGGGWHGPPALMPSAEQRLAGTPYGPDILGIRLGMPLVDAEALVRANLHVTAVLDTRKRPATVRELDDVLRGRLFVDAVSKESIALFDAPPWADGRVVAVWRSLPVPHDAWSRLLERLVAKYGHPADTKDREAVWTERKFSGRDNADCELGAGGDHWTWMVDGRSTAVSSLAGEFPETARPGGDPKLGFEGCGPTLRADSPPPLVDSPTTPLETQLYDLNVASWLLRQATAKPAAPMPQIKF